MSEVERSLIKTGFWTNHAQGTVLGATITMEQQYSNLIVALVAVVVATAAASAFNLILFALYQLRATNHTKDGLYWQQQALYRSLATPGTVFMDSLKFWHAWRGRISSPILARCLLPASVGLLFGLASLAAGVFSSYVVTQADLEVLVRSDLCHLRNYTAYLTGNLTGDSGTFPPALDAAASSFARSCYMPGPLPSSCNVYINPRIEPTLSFVDCPFDPSLCFNGTRAAVLDSGLLDSNDVLGINAPPSDRVLIRRKATCVPLDTASHTQLLNSSDPIIQSALETWRPLTLRNSPELMRVAQWWTARFGSTIGSADNVTDIYSTIESNATTRYSFDAWVAHQFPNDLVQYFEPIEGLAKEQGDVAVVFVHTNSVSSPIPIEDPIYSAHREIDGSYLPDYPISTLGCIEEWQFCVRNDEQTECTLLGSAVPSFDMLREHIPSANPVQHATFDLLAPITLITGLQATIQTMQPFLNVTSRYFSALWIEEVPANQWVFDFQALESYVWAFSRIAILWHFTGYPGIPMEATILPDSAAAWQVCRSQKVKVAGAFANVNVFGLAFTLAVAGLFLLLDFVGLRIYTIRGQFKKLPKVQSWIDDGLYELQRRAFERYVDKPWDRIDKEIPVTLRDEPMDSLSAYAAAASHTAVLLSSTKPSLASSSTSSTLASNPATPAVMPSVTQPNNATQSSNNSQAVNSTSPPSRPISVQMSRSPSTISRHSSVSTQSPTSSGQTASAP